MPNNILFHRDFCILFHGIIITNIHLGITIQIINYFACKTYNCNYNKYTSLHYPNGRHINNPIFPHFGFLLEFPRDFIVGRPDRPR